MKNRSFMALCIAFAVIPAISFAQTVPTGDAPIGIQPASQGSPSGRVVELEVGMPVKAMTTLGHQGWLEMDSHGAYWWGRNIDANGRLVNAHSARQGTYAELDTGRYIVVR